MKFIYQKITDMIIEKLQNGVVPWQKTWQTAYPENYISGLKYKGVNTMLLGIPDYSSNQWLTFKQCKDIGGSIKKDEHSSIVIFWKPIVRIENNALDETTADINFLLRYYNVFNTDQCNIPDEVIEKKGIKHTNAKIMEAEQIIQKYQNPPDIAFNNYIPNPRYLPRLDRVEIQSIDNFNTSDDYYASLYHELVHSTGAKHRLARHGITETIQFGSENYSKEELVAEIGASMCCNLSGIHKTFDNQASYIQNWLEVFHNDFRMITIAASQAQKAVDLILNNSSTNTQEDK